MSDSFDSGEFRKVLGHYPTGVTLVTSTDGDGRIGAVMGSFGSVSLDPPLVMFMPTRDSGSWQRIEASGVFTANVLRDEHVGLCNAFFQKDVTCWDQAKWSEGVNGAPVLDDALCAVECEIESVTDAGDHVIVLGRVVGISATDDEDANALLFFKGGYGHFESI